MAKRKDDEMIVGLDIGTSKVVAIVGEINAENEIEVIGIGTHRSTGLKKGVVINIDSTVESIKRAVQEAELMADCQVFSVYAGIAGNHIKSFNSHGMAAIRDKHEVTDADVKDALQAAEAMQIPEHQKKLHVLPQEFIIDQQEGIRQPVGMAGVRLETKVHLVTAAESAMSNIEKCIRQSGLETDGIILEQLASSYAVLTEDEKEMKYLSLHRSKSDRAYKGGEILDIRQADEEEIREHYQSIKKSIPESTAANRQRMIITFQMTFFMPIATHFYLGTTRSASVSRGLAFTRFY